VAAWVPHGAVSSSWPAARAAIAAPAILVFALVCQQRSMVRATGYPAMQGRLVEFDRLNQTR
jgi:hypothetical protein